ncbi:uncharacterized protein LOC108887488 [Lates japonicus]
MNPLLLIFIFVLHFEAGICEGLNLYHRPGHDVTLPCGSGSSPHTTCSSTTWLFNREQFPTITEVLNGNIQRSDRAARLSLNTDCSLLINNITAEDVGFYVCRQIGQHEARVFLNIMTVSQSPDTDPKRDGEERIECSLSRYRALGPCKETSILWLDETGTVLVGEHDGYKVTQMDCVSVLTVKRQRGHNRRYTCRFVDENNKVQMEADYTPVVTGDMNKDSTDWSPLSYVMLTLRITGLILMIVITVAVIRYSGSKKTLEDLN